MGIFWASRTFERIDDKLLRDRSSARSFSTPGICLSVRVKENCASIKKRHLSRCMRSGFLLDLLATMCVVASLSQ